MSQYGQERVSAPGSMGPGMGEQLWELSLRIEDEVKQTIDFKHSKWEFPITANVRTVNC